PLEQRVERERLDLDVDPDRREVALHDLTHPVARRLVAGVEHRGSASAARQAPRRAEVRGEQIRADIPVAEYPRGGVLVDGAQRVTEGAAETCQGSAVDRVIHRLPKPEIAEERPMGIQLEEVESDERIDEELLMCSLGRLAP